jgi:hypothetical protein
LPERYGTMLPDDTGGEARSTVPGTTGTSTDPGTEPADVVTTRSWVDSTAAGASMPLIVGGTVTGAGSSSERAKPYATSPAATTTTPAATLMRVTRERRLDSTGSTTTATLSR